MHGLFKPDSKIFALLSKFTDCVLLTMLWLLFSAPIITLGASTSAAYYTTHKVLCNEEGTLWRSFWHSFKQNFLLATCAYLMFLVLSIVLIIDFLYINTVAQEFVIIFVVLFAINLAWAVYTFAYIARFNDTLKKALKNSLAMCILNLPWTLIILAFSLALPTFLLTFSRNLLMILVLPVTFFLITGRVMERIFQKYTRDKEESQGQ